MDTYLSLAYEIRKKKRFFDKKKEIVSTWVINKGAKKLAEYVLFQKGIKTAFMLLHTDFANFRHVL